MGLTTMNLLDHLWRIGIEPIKETLAQKLSKSNVINNLLTTKSGYALDARQGKVLQDQIGEINSNLGELNTGLTQIISIKDQLAYNSDTVVIEAANKMGNLVHIRGLLRAQVNAGISFLTFRAAETFSFVCLNYSALNNKDYQCFVYASLSKDGIFINGVEHSYNYTAFDVHFFIQ